MQLLKNRFLAISVIIAVATMAISMFLSPTINTMLICICLILSILSAIFGLFLKRNTKRRPNFPRVFTYIALTLVLISVLLTSSYGFFQRDIKTAKSFVGETVKVSGSVLNVSYSKAYRARVEASISEINGIMTDLKAIIDFETDSPLYDQDIFTLEGTLYLLEGDNSYMKADGFSARLEVADLESVSVNGKSREQWYAPFIKLSGYLCNKLDSLLDADTSSITKAMLLGNRSSLEDETSRDFRRIGISHMLALSGLHVSVLLGGVDMLLRWVRVSKTKRSLFLIISALFYLALTGFSLSAVRAVIMACMVYLSYIVSNETDGTTSLFLSAFIILAISPSGILDIGFWMSFTATLSLIIVSELISPLTFKLKKKPLYVQISVYLLSAVGTTIGATVGTVAFSWLVFKELSLISVLSNLIFTIPTITVLILGALLLVFFWIPPIASFLAFILNLTVKMFLETASWISHWRGITVSLNYEFVKFIIIPMITITVIFILIYLKRRWLIAFPTALAAIAFSVCLMCYNGSHSGMSTVSYLKNGGSEMLTVVNNRESVIIDMSSGGISHFMIANDEIVNQNGTEIEKLILTHFHQYHPNALKRMCLSYMVREIYLPEPQRENDIKWYNSIVLSLEDTNTLVKMYMPGDTIDIGDTCNVRVSEYFYLERSVHPMYYIKITDSNESLVYLSSSICESNDFNGIDYSEHLIFGVHGPNIHIPPKYSKYILDEKTSVILADANKQMSKELTDSVSAYFAEDKYVYSTRLDGK